MEEESRNENMKKETIFKKENGGVGVGVGGGSKGSDGTEEGGK
jgi:hypothetical protein